jgi:hypothetical protein
MKRAQLRALFQSSAGNLAPRDAGNALSRQDTNLITNAKLFIFLLRYCDQLAALKPDRNFHTATIIITFFHGIADQAADNRTSNGSGSIGAVSTANSRTPYAAQRRTDKGSRARFCSARVDQNIPDCLNNAQSNIHFTADLAAVVVATAHAWRDTTRQHYAGEQCTRQHYKS